MPRLKVDDNLIVTAFLVVIAKNKRQFMDRPLRLLQQKDLDEIRKVRAALASRRQEERVGPSEYYIWRKHKLDSWAMEKCWTLETRNLYASILSTLTTWVRNDGIDQKSRKILEKVRPGADLLLPFLLTNYQPQLKGLHS